MCLSVPARVVELFEEGSRRKACVDVSGNHLTVDLELVAEVAVGDYLLIHAGLAIEKYSHEVACQVLKVHGELAAVEQAPPAVRTGSLRFDKH